MNSAYDVLQTFCTKFVAHEYFKQYEKEFRPFSACTVIVTCLILLNGGMLLNVSLFICITGVPGICFKPEIRFLLFVLICY